MAQALGPRDQSGVGHRVGGPGQQVRQAYRLAERRRQHGEREIEAPADLPQEIAEQVIGHVT